MSDSWVLFRQFPENCAVADCAAAFLYAAQQGWLAPDLVDAVAEPDAMRKLVARRAFLRVIRTGVALADGQLLSALEAAPDQWLRHGATQRFLRRWVRGRTAPLADEHLRQYAAICLRVHGNERDAAEVVALARSKSQ